MNSQSSGCTDRVKMSRWSCRSLRSSAQPIATVPSRRRPALTTSGRRATSTKPAGALSAGADIPEAPSFLEPSPGGGGEHVLERGGAELLPQLVRRPERDDFSQIHDC